MIKFRLYDNANQEFKFLMDDARCFYWDGPEQFPVLEDRWTGILGNWNTEIQPQLDAIRDMTSEEFVLFKLKWM